MTSNNFNYDSLTILVDHIAESLIHAAINPNYMAIRTILLSDNVKNHREFQDKYGLKCFETFITIYRKV